MQMIEHLYDNGIRTHDLSDMSLLPLLLDEGSRPINSSLTYV